MEKTDFKSLINRYSGRLGKDQSRQLANLICKETTDTRCPPKYTLKYRTLFAKCIDKILDYVEEKSKKKYTPNEKDSPYLFDWAFYTNYIKFEKMEDFQKNILPLNGPLSDKINQITDEYFSKSSERDKEPSFNPSFARGFSTVLINVLANKPNIKRFSDGLEYKQKQIDMLFC